jgi:hypothetical protein
VIDDKSNLLQNPVIAPYHKDSQELMQSADTVNVNLRKHQTRQSVAPQFPFGGVVS